MAFLRKKGKYFYLVHSVREKDGRIRHRTLAYLGKSAEITPQIRAQVEDEFPDISVDWKALASNVIESSVTSVESEEHSKKDTPAVISIETIPQSRKTKDKRLPAKPEKWLEWD